MNSSENTFRMTGHIIDNTTRRGVPRLRVAAWDKDLILHDLVGSAVTDEQGAFQMECSESYFRKLFPDRWPDLFCKIFHQAEAFYGLFRQNLPTDLAALLVQSPEALRQALEEAVKEHIIPTLSQEEIDKILECLKQLFVTQAFEALAEEGRVSVVQLLRTVIPETSQQADFLTAYITYTSPIEAFWKGLRGCLETKPL